MKSNLGHCYELFKQEDNGVLDLPSFKKQKMVTG